TPDATAADIILYLAALHPHGYGTPNPDPQPPPPHPAAHTPAQETPAEQTMAEQTAAGSLQPTHADTRPSASNAASDEGGGSSSSSSDGVTNDDLVLFETLTENTDLVMLPSGTSQPTGTPAYDDVTGALPNRADSSQPVPELDDLLLGFGSDLTHPRPFQLDPTQPPTETDDSIFAGGFFNQLLNDPFVDPSIASTLFDPLSLELALTQDDVHDPASSSAGQTTGTGETGNSLEMTLEEVDQYADLPTLTDPYIDTDLTATVLESQPPAGTGNTETDGVGSARALGQDGDTGEETPTTSPTGKGKQPAVESESESDDETFGNRLSKAGPVVFNDWTEEGEEEQEDPELAFIWAGFQTVLEASPAHPTDTHSPGITGTSASRLTGTSPAHQPGHSNSPPPQPQEGSHIGHEDLPLGQTPRDTREETPGEVAGAGLWQDYLDELLRTPGNGQSEGRDQAVQTLQDLIADTAFGGPFEDDIAAAHPILFQHSPAYRTHFTTFQHTHTTHTTTTHDPDMGTDTDAERDDAISPAVTGPVPDPALQNYWMALTTRPSSPPDPPGRHTTAPGAETIPPGGPLTAGAEPGPAAGHPQDMDIDDGPQHAGEHTPAGPPSAHDRHPDTDTGSDDGRMGNADAMQTEDDQPHSPQTGPEESDDKAQPSAWERYLDAAAALPDEPSTQKVRQVLQDLIDGTLTALDRPTHNLLRKHPGYRDDGTAFISAYDEVKDQDADARAIHLSFT
ncbi:hypothetical protein ACFRFD_39575, partial [Streptomyces sp. NPDC056632]